MRAKTGPLLAVLLIGLTVISACGGGGGSNGSSGGSANIQSADAQLQGDWYYNSGNRTYSFDQISFVSANDGFPEGSFIGTSGGSSTNYIYDVDDTGTSFMLLRDLGGGTAQLYRTYSFAVSQSVLRLDIWNLTTYYCKSDPNSCTPPSSTNPTYSISGTVTSGGVGLSGATLTLSGAGSGTASTDANGNYTISGVVDGTYTVTPTKGGYTFAPTSTSVAVSGANQTGTNFTAIATATSSSYSISGEVSSGGTGLSGVTMTLSGNGTGSTTTDASGKYTFLGLSNGNFVVTPSMPGTTFSPKNIAVTVSGANVAGRNFTGAIVTQLTLDQQNNSNWTGGATNIAPSNNVRQTFTPSLPHLYAVEVGLMTGNSGLGGDQITLTIINSNGQVIATKTDTISEGFEGFYSFNISDNGINVTPGQTYTIQLADTNKIVFFWKYTNNSYSGGQAYFYGTPFNNNDFFFNTYGTF
jgi:hypothetical protein